MILALLQSAIGLFLFGLLTFPIVIPPVPGSITTSSECPSGRSTAKLTGWMLNNKTPVGRANYDEAAKGLEITVENVALPDGTVMSILIGEEKIGEMAPLKDGAARVVLTRPLSDQARVRIFDADRPIVSANLQCTSITQPAPTASPSPSPSISPIPSPSPSVSPIPSPSPSISPNPSPSPAPTAAPTQDPMPKRSPLPTPSPK